MFYAAETSWPYDVAVFQTESRRDDWVKSDVGIERMALTEDEARQLVGDRLTKRNLFTTEGNIKWASSEYGDYVHAHIVALEDHPTVTDVLSKGLTGNDLANLTVYDGKLMSAFFGERGDAM